MEWRALSPSLEWKVFPLQTSNRCFQPAEQNMCPLRIILIFLSAVMAFFAIIRTFSTGTPTGEDMCVYKGDEEDEEDEEDEADEGDEEDEEDDEMDEGDEEDEDGIAK